MIDMLDNSLPELKIDTNILYNSLKKKVLLDTHCRHRLPAVTWNKPSYTPISVLVNSKGINTAEKSKIMRAIR